MIHLFLITAILGFIRNFVKYKKIELLLFLRSPFLSLLIYFIIKNKLDSPILWAIILERWFLLLFKSIKSYCDDDYMRKRKKYEKKYNLTYLNKK